MGFSKEHGRAPYVEATGQVDYFYHSGIVPVPVTAPGPALMVRVHVPTSGRSLVFCVHRMGAMPSVPSPAPMDANEALISAHLKVTWPMLIADAGIEIRVEGSYVWAHKNPLVPGKDILPVGTGPYDANQPSGFSLTPQAFDQRPLRKSGKSATAVVDVSQNVIAAK